MTFYPSHSTCPNWLESIFFQLSNICEIWLYLPLATSPTFGPYSLSRPPHPGSHNGEGISRATWPRPLLSYPTGAPAVQGAGKACSTAESSRCHVLAWDTTSLRGFYTFLLLSLTEQIGPLLHMTALTNLKHVLPSLTPFKSAYGIVYTFLPRSAPLHALSRWRPWFGCGPWVHSPWRQSPSWTFQGPSPEAWGLQLPSWSPLGSRCMGNKNALALNGIRQQLG